MNAGEAFELVVSGTLAPTYAKIIDLAKMEMIKHSYASLLPLIYLYPAHTLHYVPPLTGLTRVLAVLVIATPVHSLLSPIAFIGVSREQGRQKHHREDTDRT